MNGSVTLRLPAFLWRDIESHLFRHDGEEHGAVLGVSVVERQAGTRLLAREAFFAVDGKDYTKTELSGVYRLSASFVRDAVLRCKKEGLSYLAIHNHGGKDSVAFSRVDIASHERGYPALLDILDGGIVGGLVTAQNAMAGDIWFSKRDRHKLEKAVVVGETQTQLFPSIPQSRGRSGFYDRQMRIFGEASQHVLMGQKVGIVGLGGIGSLLNQYLARLGVGHIVAVDSDRIDTSNFSRLVGSKFSDLKTGWFRKRTSKVAIAKRIYKQGNPYGRFTALDSNVEYLHIIEHLFDCDAVFLAADSMTARLVVNALCHQYLIPVWQVGTKIQNNGTAFSVSRNVLPGMSCLYCSSPLIDSARLADEAKSSYSSTYLDRVPAPSVITLNATSAALAANSYLAYVTGERASDSKDYLRNHLWSKFFHNEPNYQIQRPSVSTDCEMCQKRLAVGNLVQLPGLKL